MTLQLSVIWASVNLSCEHDRLDDMVMSFWTIGQFGVKSTGLVARGQLCGALIYYLLFA